MEATTNKLATQEQIKKIYALLGERKLKSAKDVLVGRFTSYRTGSTKAMTVTEAGKLIDYLSSEICVINHKRQLAYSAIWQMAWDMGMIYGKSDDDYHMNVAKLNMFCRERGSVKGDVNRMGLEDLQKIRRQFHAMHRKFKEKQKTEK